MPNKKIPDNCQTIMPYLIIPNASKFIDFMKKVFDAKELHNTMRDANTIMHGEVMVDGSTIMFADSTDKFPPRTAGMFIYVDNTDETFEKAVKEGAEIITKPANQPYGRSCGIIDPFGNTWWITSVL